MNTGVGLLLLAAAMAGRPHWEPTAAAVDQYNLAVDALQAHALEPAETVLRTLLETSDPDCGRCQHTLAATLLRQGHPTEALDILSTLEVSHPQQAVVWSLAAVAALTDNDMVRAQQAAARAVELTPTDLATWHVLLQVVLAQAESEQIAQTLQTAATHLPTAEVACLQVSARLASKTHDDVGGLLASCITAQPTWRDPLSLAAAQATGDHTAVLQWAQSMRATPIIAKAETAAALQRGDVNAAMEQVEQILARHPTDPDALLLRAWCWMLQGQHPQAEQDLVQLQHAEAVFYPGEDGHLLTLYSTTTIQQQAQALHVILLVNTQRVDAARALWDARPPTPFHPDSAAAEVMLLLAEERMADATQVWLHAIRQGGTSDLLANAALQMDPFAPLPEEGMAWLRNHASPTYTLHMAGQRHGDARNVDCQRALQPLFSHDDPSIAEQALQLAHRCSTAAGDLDAANAIWQQLTVQGSEPQTDAMLRHVWLLGQASQADVAVQRLQTSTHCQSHPSPCSDLHVWLLTTLGQLDEAHQIAAQHPIGADPLFNLAVALYEAGQAEQAREHMANACRQMGEPDAQQCQQVRSQMR